MKKMPSFTSRIYLGSAQFGMDYGVNNSRGKIPRKEVFDILRLAAASGIDCIDTAEAYGDSERVIGEFHRKQGDRFRINSKCFLQGSKADIKPVVEESCEKLGVDGFYAYFIHNFQQYLESPGMLASMNELKADGKIRKSGFSLYYLHELEYILHNDLPIDIVQVPYSIFDRRFEAYFDALKKRGIEINVRSIFLQGLVFKRSPELAAILDTATDKINSLGMLCEKTGIPVFAACLNFVLADPRIDSVTLGVDSIGNLRDILDAPRYAAACELMAGELRRLRVDDERVVIPLNWKKPRRAASALKIGGRSIGKGDIYFVVEEGQFNQGDFRTTLRMVDAVAGTGADAIEFQLAKAADFYVRRHVGYGIYKQRELGNGQIRELVAYTKSKGLDFICAPLSHKLVGPLVKAGCSAFTVNASDLTNPDILDAVAGSGLPFFLSVLLASEEEIEWAIDRVRKTSGCTFGLLHGQHIMASGEPALDLEHTALGYMKVLRERYGVSVGFIDHTPMNWFPSLAAAAGAEIISKHMTLSHKAKGPDWQICSDPAEMSEAITLARKSARSLNADSKNLAPGESIDKTVMRRSIVAARSLASGTVIRREDICFKRPGTGLCPSRFEEVIGKVLTRRLKADDQITDADLEEKR